MLRKWRSGAGLTFSFGLMLAIVGVATFATSVALADSYNSPAKVTTTGANTLNWTGQGITSGSLDTRECDAQNDPYGLNAPYLFWIFTFSTATISTPTLHLGGSGSGDFAGRQPSDNSSAYQFTTGFFDLSLLTANVTFNASALGQDGSAMVLTISHGCAGTPSPPPTSTTTITTTVFDAATHAALIGGTLVAGGSVYDTATVNHSAAGTATGTVTYDFFTNGTCTLGDGKGAPAGIVTLAADGSVPNSGTEGPLTAGSYSFQAIYTSGDSSFTGSTGDCEPFTVTASSPRPVDVSIATVVFNAGTNAAMVGNLIAGGSVYDTSTVTAEATGTVSYKFWTNGDCGVSEDVGGMDAGTALALGSHSKTEGPLTVGSYSFEANFASSNTDLFANATSACEPFSVSAPPPDPTPTTTSTTVFDAATSAGLIDAKLAAGGSAYDTSIVTTGATGTVSYLFWTNGDCGVSEDVAGTPAGSGLALGARSNTEGPLTAGSYSFRANYNSDNATLFAGSTSSCEPFTVVAAGASPTPTGGVLADTGESTLAQGVGIFLVALGLFAMLGGALVSRRRRI